MARYEVGTSGNPHWHGLCVGANNPSLKRVKEDVSGTCCGGGDVPVRADECKDLDVSEDDDLDDSLTQMFQAVLDEFDAAEDAVEGNAAGDEKAPAEESAGVAEPQRRAGRPKKRGKKSRPQDDMEQHRLAEALDAREKDVQSKSDMEKKLFEYFGSLVSEWNPSRDDDGRPRHFWDEDMQAYDWEIPVEAVGDSLWTLMKGHWVDTTNPIRVRLRNVLDAVYEAEARGEKLDLHPMRRLVTLLAETNQRHTKHSNGAHNPPVLGKDPCARQGDKGVYCRYHKPTNPNFPRGDDR